MYICTYNTYTHSYHWSPYLAWLSPVFWQVQMHMTMKMTMMRIKPSPTPVAMNMIMMMVWSMLAPGLGVGEAEGEEKWHSDWETAGTKRSHSKSNKYGIPSKNRTGFDKYQSLREVYNSCVWAASLVLMVPANTAAPSTSLLQNDWVMETEEELLRHGVLKEKAE